MFSLHDFVLNTIKKMIGKLPDYQVQEYSLGWYTRGTLKDEDLLEIETLIDEKNAALEAAAELQNEEEPTA